MEERNIEKKHTPLSPLPFTHAPLRGDFWGRVAGKLSPLRGRRPLVRKFVGRGRVDESSTTLRVDRPVGTRRGAGVCIRTARLDSVLLFALLILFSSCATTKEYPKGSFRVDGVMHQTTVEGGCWVFRTTDGQNFELVGEAAKELLREGLRAEIVVRPRKDLNSICMVGKIVEVVEIKEIHSDSSPR